jgi:hypothetical protein
MVYLQVMVGDGGVVRLTTLSVSFSDFVMLVEDE